MNVTEILDELERIVGANSDPEGAITTAELCDAMGLGHLSVRRRLKTLQQAGRLEVVRVKRARIDGVVQSVSAYRITPEK